MFQWCSVIFEKVQNCLKNILSVKALSTWLKFPEKGIKTDPNIIGKGNAVFQVVKNDVW